MGQSVRARYGYTVRRALTLFLPPKPLVDRVENALDRMRLRRRREEVPYLYRLAPLLRARDCHPLMDPPFLPAGEADHMHDEDVVIGIAVDGDARAYPWWIMDNHHVANDTVGGRPVAIALCEMCSSGMGFDPVVDGTRLTFRATHVYMGTNCIQDHQTKSLWSTYLSRAITGPMRDRTIDLLPVQQMEWRAWRSLHPDSVVLAPYLGRRGGHGAGHTLGTPDLSPGMRRTVPRWDKRLPHNTLVLGVIRGDAQRAYPLEVLRRHEGVINDEIDGSPIVALSYLAEGSSGALAFSRAVNGRTLTFVPDDGAGAIDVETGSRWSPEGVAVAGRYEGTRLSFVSSHVSEWFIWAAHYPSMELVVESASHDRPAGRSVMW